MLGWIWPALICWMSCLVAPAGVRAQSDEPPIVYPKQTWATARPKEMGVNPERLAEALEFFRQASGPQGISEAMVVRYGRVLYRGRDVDQRHNVWSVTKAFTSTALGLLIAAEKCTLDTRAAAFLPELAKEYPELTLRHFASMTSGYDAVGGDQSSMPFVLARPLFPPGAAFLYWDAAMNECAYVLTRIAGQPLAALLKTRVMDPIGATNWHWGDWGRVDGHLVNGGAGNQHRGIFISAENLARFGLLFLSRGSWEGKALLPAEWVEAVGRSSQPYAPTYGLNWRRHNPQTWPDAMPDTYAALGHNNNNCFIIPSLGLVVVRLGMDGVPARNTAVQNEFLKRLRWAAPPVGAGSLSGVLRDAAGRALSGAELRLQRGDALWAATSTSITGAYVLPNLSPGEYELHAHAPGVAPAILPVQVERGTHGGVDILLQPVGAIAGRITRAGTPVEGVTVAAVRDASVAASAVTDADGAYRLPELLPGETGYTLRLSGTGSAAVPVGFPAGETILVEPARTTTHDIELPQELPGSLSGRVTDTAGRPAAGLEVRLSDAALQVVAVVVTGAEGAYSLPLISPGEYFLSVAHAGEEAAVPAPVTVAAGSDVAQDLALGSEAIPPTTGSISGRLAAGADGAALPGARVEAIAAGRVWAAAPSGATGFYVLPGLMPREDYLLRVSGPGFAGASLAKLKVQAGKDTPAARLTLTAQRPGAVQGTVVDRSSGDGAALPGARVTLLQEGRAVATTVAAWDGRFHLGGLAPGTYTASFARPGYNAVSLSAAVPPGGIVPAEAGLHAAASLSGAVLRGEAPLADAQIRLLDDTGAEQARLFTDLTGRWSIPAFVPVSGGKYRLEASATGLKTQLLADLPLAPGRENGPFHFRLGDG